LPLEKEDSEKRNERIWGAEKINFECDDSGVRGKISTKKGIGKKFTINDSFTQGGAEIELLRNSTFCPRYRVRVSSCSEGWGGTLFSGGGSTFNRHYRRRKHGKRRKKVIDVRKSEKASRKGKKNGELDFLGGKGEGISIFDGQPIRELGAFKVGGIFQKLAVVMKDTTSSPVPGDGATLAKKEKRGPSKDKDAFWKIRKKGLSTERCATALFRRGKIFVQGRNWDARKTDVRKKN